MKTVSDAYSSLPRDELSATLNLDMNNATDVQSIDRTGQTDRAVYRLDPHPSGLELQHNPRLDDQINCTEARLSHPVSHANFIGQAKTEVGRVESESDRGLSLLSCLGRANDHSDELIRHFDQFMNFEQPNISKARLLRLSDDIASICPGTVHENHPSEHEDRYLRVNSLSLSRTCVSNQAAIETSGSIIGSSAALCVTKRSISSQSLRIESISSDPVECSFLRPVSVSVSRTSLTTSSTCFSLRYFILNGIERVFRCVIAPKRNHPTGMIRNSFTGKREGYSDKAVAIRCVRDDQSAVTIKVYYNRNGSARVGFWIGGREFLLPVGLVLKALTETNDEEIYESLNCCYNEHYGRGDGSIGTQLVRERAKIILDEVRDLGLFTREQCRKYLGEHFKSDIDGLEKESYPVVAEAVLKNYIFVHLDNDDDKFNLLIFIIQKLFSLVDQTSLPDNPDSLQNQEILVPGHLITIYLKEKLEEWLRKCKSTIEEEMRNVKSKFDFENHADIKKLMNRNQPRSIGTSIESLLKSGCMTTRSSLDLQQKVGYTVQAERLNFLRFLSFFRAVHRGASFAGLRTTTVRKLLPESWGFLCPVHTPDGEPCGLLNHMTRTCRISSQFDSNGNIRDFRKIRRSVVDVLVGIGMVTSLPKLVRAGPPKVIHVLLDGQVVGSLSSNLVPEVVAYLRRLKVEAPSIIPEDLEVGYVPTSMGGSYPGLYLASCPARFIRPVKNTSIPSNNLELIGPFEQVFMEISCPDGGNGGRNNSSLATHEEIDPTGMISVVANLTPWSDHNQSPRNMYQCQMAKQTMAYSTQALQFRADQKIYHLQTPQSPVVRTKTYTAYNIDENPTGTNAIVAVLAHTGFDMEDAMILNKSSVERGMCHGQIYQVRVPILIFY
ncbi:hypothetical protein F2Q68_00034939 [Brassica cretica]|uniref:DNA-directed RNA polymerase n=1 Tax=Brassica cretica TaxID=69181 RepID=A0A8S9H3U6_BRACR|nr:hypothetical protein F2Q68_00034939 [Brassica cretica]